MKIETTIWFTQMVEPSTIGIVIGTDEVTGEKKAYIGTGKGFDEDQDAKHISVTGARVTKKDAEQLIALFINE